MWRVPNSARMLLPAEAQPQLRPTPLEEEEEVGKGDRRGGTRETAGRSAGNNTAHSNSVVPL